MPYDEIRHLKVSDHVGSMISRAQSSLTALQILSSRSSASRHIGYDANSGIGVAEIHLFWLPTELFCQMATLLDDVDRACLALTCKTALSCVLSVATTAIGQQWRKPWEYSHQRHHLLLRLAEGWIDRSAWRYCGRCCKFYPRDPIFFERRVARARYVRSLSGVIVRLRVLDTPPAGRMQTVSKSYIKTWCNTRQPVRRPGPMSMTSHPESTRDQQRSSAPELILSDASIEHWMRFWTAKCPCCIIAQCAGDDARRRKRRYPPTASRAAESFLGVWHQVLAALTMLLCMSIDVVLQWARSAKTRAAVIWSTTS